MAKNELKPVIGFETHVELTTESKMFCGCPADHFGKKPNTQTCPVCLGLPGALPVPQKKAVDWTVMIGLALNCKIAKRSKFDRKHYFYPDLPKGYQISQYDEPLCVDGYLETSQGKVRITRVHLEEDTGKLKHSNLNGKNVSLVDFNRSGVPLVEIVTEPEIHSSSQAKEFGQKLQQIIRQLGVSDCDMEKGSMRLEANISWGMDLNYKVEVKNVNSFKFIAKAIDYELKRQKEILDNGVTPEQETRGWDEQGNKTKSQRSKETAADYRYFPEPDIPPMSLTDEEIETLRGQLPELPEEMIVRWVKTYGLREDYAGVLMADGLVADYADQVFELANEAKADINKLAGEIVNKRVDVSKVGPSELIEKHKHDQNEFVSDENELELWTREAMLALPDAVKDYQGGKQVAIGVLVGKVMQLSKGKANPGKVKEMLEKNLEE